MEECNTCGNDHFFTEENRIQCSLCLTYCNLAIETEGGCEEYCEEKKDVKAHDRNSTNSDPLKQVGNESKIIEWTTHDGFNIILRKQVDCLIKLGANHKLQDVVLQLWAHYLHLISFAFPDRDPDTDVIFSVPNNRNYSFANSKKYKLKHRRVSVYHRKPHSKPSAPLPEKHKKMKKKLIKNKKHKKNLVEDSSDDEIPLLFLQMEKLKEKLKEESDSDSATNKDMIYKKKLIDVRRLMKTQAHQVSAFASRQVDCMNMIKTVSFCYLGILIVEDSILLSDIIRWIREGHFPYLEGMNLLPSDMKLHRSDCRTFSRIKPPSCYIVRQTAGKLAFFLGLQDFPKPSLDALVARFIMDLNLPTELNSCVKALIDIKPMNMFWGKTTSRKKFNYFEDPTNISIPDYEGRVMALIVVALKLLFGLDDHTERDISSYAQKQSTLHQSEKVFVWSEWVDQLNLKMNLSNACCAPYGLSEYGDGIMDVSSMHQFFRQTILKRQQPTTSKTEKGCEKNDIYPFYALFVHLNNSNTRLTRDQKQPTSFPLSHVTQLFHSQCGNEKSFRLQDFRNSTLLYLTQPHLWNYVHKNNNMNEVLASPIEDGSEAFLWNSDYWFYDAKSHDLNRSSLEVLPQSFQWLLNMLCLPIELKPTELYAKVVLIEKIVLKCGKLTKQCRLSIEKVLW